jgi:hypothetical protein
MPTNNIPQATDHPAHSLPAEARRPVSSNTQERQTFMNADDGNFTGTVQPCQSRPSSQVTPPRTGPGWTDKEAWYARYLEWRAEPVTPEEMAATRRAVEQALADGDKLAAEIFAFLHGRTVDEVLSGVLSGGEQR